MMRLSLLKLCRFERGVMQTVLARRADIAWGRLSAIENGDAEAQPEELQRIAAALQVPLDALVTRSGVRSAH
jgi:transcriptional regulator with XRE-family HTH domain